MSRNILILFIFLVLLPAAYGEDSGTRISPESRIQQLMEDDGKTDEQRRLDYIEAAEIKQMIGDLKGAAELFKKASLTVKGRKDFDALYRAAVLNIEMAFFREAGADLRAILTFSDDVRLRIMSNIQNARIEKYNGRVDSARDIMREILASSDYLPVEAVRFASELFTPAELQEITGKPVSQLAAEEYITIAPMLTPENVFGAFREYGTEADTEQPEYSPEVENADADVSAPAAAGIQLGSFSVRENAEDLVRTVKEAGYDSSIKIKDVNGKEYYTVVVPVPAESEIQKMIIGLKEKGFEGYPVY